MRDAIEVLAEEPYNLVALYTRAEALFNLCEFEQGLAVFYRGSVGLRVGRLDLET